MANNRINRRGAFKASDEVDLEDGYDEEQSDVRSIVNFNYKKPEISKRTNGKQLKVRITVALFAVSVLILLLLMSTVAQDETVNEYKAEQISIQQDEFIAPQQSSNKLSPEITQPQVLIVPNTTSPTIAQQQFIIPQLVWVYLDSDIQRDNYISRLSFENIKHYAAESKFQSRIVGRNDYGQWLPKERKREVQEVLQRVKSEPSLRNSQDLLFSKLISLFLLREHGGIIMNRRFIFVQKLDWLRTISRNIIANRGRPDVVAKYFTFFLMDAGPRWQKQNKEATSEMDKMMYIFPGICDYFLAGVPNGQFINDLIKSYTQLLQTPTSLRIQLVKKHNLQLGNLDPNNIYHLFSIAGHLTVQIKQTELDAQQTQKYRNFAIDYYGLITVNQFYGPQKMHYYFKNRVNSRNYFDNYFNIAARLTQNEFEELAGPIRFIANPEPSGNELGRRLQAAKSNQSYQIWLRSLVHRHLYLNRSEPFIKPNKQKSTINTNFRQWDSLPKKLCLFWDSGIENASAANQLCYYNIIKNAKEAGFEVFEVSNSNLKDYISPNELNRIEETIRKAQFAVRSQARSDFVRLALLEAHGGIYMDLSYIWLQNFKWFIQIAKQPSHVIFNRFGDLPKVLLQFHPIQGTPFSWEFDQAANTKSTWHLAYENNLIAAQKDSEFIKEWNDMFHFFVKKLIRRNREEDDRVWTQKYDRYLTAMDSLKTVIGCRTNQIKANPSLYPNIRHGADYYKIWGFNGFTGLQKFRFYNDYTFAFGGAVNNAAEAFYRISMAFANATIGPVYKGIKLYGYNIQSLNIFLSQHRYNEFQAEVHPDSYFFRYYYNKEQYQFYISNQLHIRRRKI